LLLYWFPFVLQTRPFSLMQTTPVISAVHLTTAIILIGRHRAVRHLIKLHVRHLRLEPCGVLQSLHHLHQATVISAVYLTTASILLGRRLAVKHPTSLHVRHPQVEPCGAQESLRHLGPRETRLLEHILDCTLRVALRDSRQWLKMQALYPSPGYG